MIWKTTLLAILLIWVATGSSAQQPIKILRIGDSNTSGYTGKNFFKDLMADAGIPWEAQGTRKAWAHFGDHNYSEGFGGTKIEFFTEYQTMYKEEALNYVPIERIFNDFAPDYVFLMIGTNNMSGKTSLDIADLQDKFNLLLNEIENRMPSHTEVLVAEIPPAADPLRNQLTYQFNQEVVIPLVQQRIDQGKGFHLVDNYSILDPATDLMDAVHPNDDGLELVNISWFNKLMEVLNDEDPPSGNANILIPTNDLYTQGSSVLNNTLLRVESGNRTSYIQFEIDGLSGTLTSAQLELTVADDAGFGTVEVYATESNWSESTFDNLPSTGVLLDQLTGDFTAGATYTWDVTDAIIETGTYSFIVTQLPGGNDVSFQSSENVNGPELLIATDGQTAYGEQAISIPGVLQAEDFDNGGQGVAYSDQDQANQGGDYRSEGVDIEEMMDASDNFYVGWTASGEWLEYTVQIEQGGLYSMAAVVASEPGTGMISVSLKGLPLVPATPVPPTGGWYNWQTIALGSYNLPEGEQVLRINIEAAGLNLDQLIFAQELITGTEEIRMDRSDFDNAQLWQVYDLQGRLCLSGKSEEVKLYQLPDQVYVLKVGGEVTKVVKR